MSRLLELRSQRGWSQDQLAELIGVTGATVSRYENGGMIPKVPVMQKIVDVFGGEITPNDFYEGKQSCTFASSQPQ